MAFQRAQATYRVGKLVEAGNILRESLLADSSHAPSVHLLGIIEARQQRFDAALQHFDAALSLKPGNAGYLVDRANVIASMGRPEEAVAAYDAALAIDPKLPEAHSNRGQALRMLNRLPEAAESFRRAVALKPAFIDAHCALGDVLAETKDLEGAIRAYSQALALNPAHIGALLNRGTCQDHLKRHAKAESDFRKITELVPEHAEAHGKRADMLLELDQPKLALAAAERAIALQPEKAAWYVAKGKALHNLDRFGESVEQFDIATAKGGDLPDILLAKGSALQGVGDHEGALAHYDRGIRMRPGVAVWFYNRGVTLMQLRRYDEAIASFDEAVARDPAHAPAHWNSALCLLTLGNPKGWDLYEWRWKLEKGGPDKAAQPTGLPSWHGFEPLAGKRILLTSEQGLGDTLMFCRYAKLVADLGAAVSLAVPSALCRLLEPLAGVHAVLDRVEPHKLDVFDYYCPLMSLPRIFETTFDNIPSGKAPYLQSDPSLVTAWRERLAAAGVPADRPRIGIVWSGRVVKSLGVRSMSLASMLTLVDARYTVVSLQKEASPEELDQLRAMGVFHFGDEQQGFADAAALVELMDLVVTIDTSVAHLSGGLGKETWVILQFSAEWRWLLGRDDSPWYPNARLFRQPNPGNWEAALSAVKQALQARF